MAGRVGIVISVVVLAGCTTDVTTAGSWTEKSLRTEIVQTSVFVGTNITGTITSSPFRLQGKVPLENCNLKISLSGLLPNSVYLVKADGEELPSLFTGRTGKGTTTGTAPVLGVTSLSLEVWEDNGWSEVGLLFSDGTTAPGIRIDDKRCPIS
jgi:hypothetical protein